MTWWKLISNVIICPFCFVFFNYQIVKTADFDLEIVEALRKWILFWKNRPSIEIRIFLGCKPRNRRPCHVTAPRDTYGGGYKNAGTTVSIFGVSFKRCGQIHGERSAPRVQWVPKRHYVRFGEFSTVEPTSTIPKTIFCELTRAWH